MAFYLAGVKKHPFFFSVYQVVKVATGGPTAATAVSARMGPCVTLSQEPVSAQTATKDGAVRINVSLATMARAASCNVNASTVPPATTRRGNAYVHQATWVPCEYQR